MLNRYHRLLAKNSIPLRTCCIRNFSSAVAAEAAALEATSAEAAKAKNDKKRHAVKFKVGVTNITEAFDVMKGHAWANFDETVEAIVCLNVDPRKPNQSIRGVASLPYGVGKTVTVGVFARDADAQAALDAGADVVGAEDLIARVVAGEIPFQRVIATPELMPQLAKIGKLLGPKGLMPNPKLGTVTKDVASAVAKAKAGAVQYRVDRKGIIHAGIGKCSFPTTHLLENFRSFMLSIVDSKPETLKGKYISNVYLKSTMGPSITIEVANADPTNARFMLDAAALSKR